MASRKKAIPDESFGGPILAIRFVQLVDGRKILQYSKMSGVWDTPETVDVRSLTEDEQAEILEALNHNDPNFR